MKNFRENRKDGNQIKFPLPECFQCNFEAFLIKDKVFLFGVKLMKKELQKYEKRET